MLQTSIRLTGSNGPAEVYLSVKMKINVERNVMCSVMKCPPIRRLEMLQSGLHSRKTMLYMVRTWLIQIGKRSYSKLAIPLPPTARIGPADVTAPVACCGLPKKLVHYELIHA